MTRLHSLASRAPLGAPVLLAIASVVAAWAASAGHWSTVLRPALVSATAAIVLTVLFWLALRRSGWAVGAASVAVVVVAGSPIAPLVVLGVCGWAALAYWRWVRTRVATSFPQTGTIAFAMLLLIVTAVSAVVDGAVVEGDLAFTPQNAAAASGDQPSIYILLLDGYPRADTLLAEFGYDNSAFIDALEDMGFAEYPNAASPAARTELTLLSMLGGTVDGSLPPAFQPNTRERRAVRQAIHEAPAIESLISRGYRLIHIASPIVHTNVTGWDRSVDTGQVNELEASLLQRSLLAPLLADWIISQQHDRLTDSLEAFAAEASDAQLKIVLAHVMAPHPPFLMDPLECWSARTCALHEVRPAQLRLTEAEYADAFGDQLDIVNDLALDAVASIVATDPDAIVVVMGDHGARHDDDPDEWRRSLLAVRGSDALADDPSAQDLIPRLLSLPEETSAGEWHPVVGLPASEADSAALGLRTLAEQ